MKTYFLSACLFFIASLFFTANAAETIKGDGEIVTKQISVTSYNSIDLGQFTYGNNSFSFSSLWNGTYKVASPIFRYSQEEKPSLTITTDKNILPHIIVSVKDNILTIQTEKGYAILPSKLLFKGTSTELKEVNVSRGSDFYLDSSLKGTLLEANVSGGGSLYLENPIEMDKCNFSISGGGDLKASSLNCKEIEANISGGGDVYLTGCADEGEINISGGGDLHAYKMEIKELVCNVSGGGDAEVNVSQKLNAHVSGGGDLYYKGNPNKKATSTNGGGEIHMVK